MSRELPIEERMKINDEIYGAEEYFYDIFYKKFYDDGGFCFKYGVGKIVKDEDNPKSHCKIPAFINYTPDFVCHFNGHIFMVEVKGFKDIFYLKYHAYQIYKKWNDDYCPVYFFLKHYPDPNPLIEYEKNEILISLVKIDEIIKKTRVDISGKGTEDIYPVDYHFQKEGNKGPECYKLPFKDLLKYEV